MPRRRKASRVRARIAIGLVKTHGIALAEVARRLGGYHLGDFKDRKTGGSISQLSLQRPIYFTVYNVPFISFIFYYEVNDNSNE